MSHPGNQAAHRRQHDSRFTLPFCAKNSIHMRSECEYFLIRTFRPVPYPTSRKEKIERRLQLTLIDVENAINPLGKKHSGSLGRVEHVKHATE